MAKKTIPFTFDKDALCGKVRNMKAVFLDMNAWIRMTDDETPQATGIKDALRRAVSGGRVFCPLSYGVLTELYKQEYYSRMRVGELMEDLSLNVAYANQGEVFAWEVERFVSRELGVGPVDLSLSGLYVPPVLYMSSALKMSYPEEADSEEVRGKVEGLRQTLESLTVTEILKMRYRNGEDWEGKYVKGLPDPPLAGVVQKIRWCLTGVARLGGITTRSGSTHDPSGPPPSLASAAGSPPAGSLDAASAPASRSCSCTR